MSQLRITKPAPEFSGIAVYDGDFKDISLSDYKGKYVVFFFYPFDFTFVCPTEIIAFSERVEEFRAINCEVIACSTDSHFSHLAWLNTPRKQGGLGNMKIPLLADKTYEIAKAYGVLKEDEGAAFRGLFIIDDKGNLRQITINDMPVGRSVDETLRLVQAFQFTDKHGEAPLYPSYTCDTPLSSTHQDHPQISDAIEHMPDIIPDDLEDTGYGGEVADISSSTDDTLTGNIDAVVTTGDASGEVSHGNETEVFVYHSEDRKLYVSHEPPLSPPKLGRCHPNACCHYL